MRRTADARLFLLPAPHVSREIDARKSWCSGAHDLSNALVSCWKEAGEAMRAAAALGQPGAHSHGCLARRHAGSDCIDVRFERVPAVPVGAADF